MMNQYLRTPSESIDYEKKYKKLLCDSDAVVLLSLDRVTSEILTQCSKKFCISFFTCYLL